MKANSIFFLMTLLALTVFTSCGSKNEAGEGGNNNSTSPITTGLTGTPSTTITNFDSFISNVESGNFKANLRSDSRFDYIMRTTSTSSSSFNFYCNIPFICDSNEINNNSMPIFSRRLINTSTLEARSSNDDGTMSVDLHTLKAQLAALMRDAERTSNSFNRNYIQVRQRAYMFFSGNKDYVVDLDKPLAAQPVYMRNRSNGETYDFLTEY